MKTWAAILVGLACCILIAPPLVSLNYSFVLEAIAAFQENPNEVNRIGLEKAQSTASFLNLCVKMFLAAPFVYASFRISMRENTTKQLS